MEREGPPRRVPTPPLQEGDFAVDLSNVVAKEGATRGTGKKAAAAPARGKRAAPAPAAAPASQRPRRAAAVATRGGGGAKAKGGRKAAAPKPHSPTPSGADSGEDDVSDGNPATTSSDGSGDTVVADSQPEAAKAGRRARGAPAPVRLSTRQLLRMANTRLPVSLSTPAGGDGMATPAARNAGGRGGGPAAAIPIPGVSRVASPWATPALASVATPATGALPERPAPASGVFQGLPTPAASPVALRRRRPASVDKEEMAAAVAPAAANGGRTPSRFGPGGRAAAPRARAPAPTIAASGGPWTAPRPWDAGARRRRPAPAGDENAAPGVGEATAKAAAPAPPAAALAPAAAASATPVARLAAATSTPPSSRRATGAAPPAPTDRVIALTSVGDDVAAAARAAVRTVPGARLAPDGGEDGATHLVLGAERRTLKVLLAVAAGAVLVTPSWLGASAAAGAWAPEGEHAPRSRFAAAAARARAARAAGQPAPLAGERVTVHATGPGADSGALRRVAVALGASLARSLGAATLCVVAGGGAPPPGLAPGAAAVGDEWLLLAAERWAWPSGVGGAGGESAAAAR